jgi:predicted house-cleaning noncanonical NTP pyrophosphatase (MazG superfamily)
MKTNFDKLIKEIHTFEKKAGFDKTPKKTLTNWLQKELTAYKKSKSKSKKQNKLSDMIVLIMQIARRENISLDKALKIHWKKSEKYLK